jgi:zeta-carotene desaturase
MKVVVIGAGFAGEAAAIAVQARHDVTLLERRGVLGGRATSYRDAVSNEDIDNAPQLLGPGDEHALELLRSVGASDLLARRDRAGAAVLVARCGWALIHERVIGHFVAQGGKVRRRALVERVVIEADRVVGVSGVQRAQSPGQRRAGKRAEEFHLEADAVIAAVPWFALADLLPYPWCRQPAFADLRAIVGDTAVCVHVWLDERIVEAAFVSWDDPHVDAVFDQSQVHQRATPPQHLVLRMTADVVIHSNSEIAALAVAALQRRFSTLREATILRTLVLREPGACYPSGAAAEAARLPTQTALAGLLLAGDWTATGLPASIESATRSGLLAAQAVERLA